MMLNLGSEGGENGFDIMIGGGGGGGELGGMVGWMRRLGVIGVGIECKSVKGLD